MKVRFLFFFLLLSSCGYHLGRTKNSEKIEISIPYIKDDFNGLFTNELIKQVSYCPNISYKYTDADYVLNIKILSKSTKQIGYKYDRNNQNVRKKNLRPTEGRQIITVNVEMVDAKTNQTKFGPFQVSADSAFDYVEQDSLNDLSFIAPNGQRLTVLSYSLGQLESIESAKEAALKPLYESLSKKIVDAISAYW